MRNSNKIRLAVFLSVALHLLLISIIKYKDYTPDVKKNKTIAIDYYKIKPEPKDVAKKPVRKPKVVAKKRIEKKPELKKREVKNKEVKKPEKLPDIKDKKFALKDIAPPPKGVEKGNVNKKLEITDTSLKKELAVKKIIDSKKDSTPESAPEVKEPEEKIVKEPAEEKKVANKIDLPEKSDLKAEKDDIEIPKPVGKEKDDVRIARLIPSIERLEELEKLERESARGIPDSEFESIRLDSADVRYVSYLDHIKLAIELAWNYPEEAARRGIQGEGVLSFTIGKEGELKDIRILNTTGSKILDKRFLRAVSMASPFPPLPDNIKSRNLKIVATYRYILSIVY